MTPYFLFAAVLLSAPADWVRQGRQAEEAGRYSAAVSYYSRVLDEAPRSGWARAAQTRRDYILEYDDAGFAPLRKFESMRRQYSRLGSERAMSLAREILKDHPDAAIVPRVLLWLGGESLTKAGKPGDAQKYYRILADGYPEHELAPIALQRTGRLLEEQGRFREAERVYRDMEERYPDLVGSKTFPSRRSLAVKKFWRQLATYGAMGVLGLIVPAFFLVGGLRLRKDVFVEQALPKAGFLLFMGLAPAAFLWVYDDQWSPSLTAMGLSFGAYALVLGALAARVRVPGGTAVRFFERALFSVLAPLGILVMIVDAFELWPAFYL